MRPWCLPSSFPSIQLTVREQVTNEDLQDSRRRCCSKIFKKSDNFSNSESLCRFDASNQVLTQSDLCLGGDVVWRISRWQLWRPSWISELKDFSNTESLCLCDASHQVLVQSNTVWEEMSLEEFQDRVHGSHLRYRNGTTLAILNLYVAQIPPIMFWQSHLLFGRWCRLKYFKMAAMAAILDMGTERFKQFCFSITLESLPSSFSSIRLI